MSTRFRDEVNQWTKNIQFALLPGTCLVCRRPSRRQADLCQACEQALPRLQRPCLRCAEPLPPAALALQLCGACLRRPPPFSTCVAPLRYAAPVDKLVSDFKYHAKLPAGKLLGGLLSEAVAAFYADRPLPTLILPVPLHPGRLRRRGFNQARELARPLSRRFALPVDYASLERRHATPAQQGLSARERRRNLRGAFALAERNPLRGSPCVALLDDVVTTMSTAGAITELLLAHGVGEVHLWAAARACRDID